MAAYYLFARDSASILKSMPDKRHKLPKGTRRGIQAGALYGAAISNAKGYPIKGRAGVTITSAAVGGAVGTGVHYAGKSAAGQKFVQGIKTGTHKIQDHARPRKGVWGHGHKKP